MGVDHGGRRDNSVPQNLERGIVPPDFVMLQNIKHQDYLHYNVGKCVFCLYSGTFIVSPAMRPPRIPVRSTG